MPLLVLVYLSNDIFYQNIDIPLNNQIISVTFVLFFTNLTIQSCPEIQNNIVEFFYFKFIMYPLL